MSDTARPKSGGDKMSADEINADLPIILTAGETINGATLPVACYIGTDGELYACDGNDTSKLDFIGFAISNSTDGNDITFQKDGVVSGFTGLTVGVRYYVQDDKTIGINKGTYSIYVGIAISSTQILIIKGPKYSSGTEYNTTSSGTQNIPHNLGVKPDRIRINALQQPTAGTTNNGTSSIGTYDGTNTESINRGTASAGFGYTYIIYLNASSGNSFVATVTFDETNIILNWTEGGVFPNEVYLLWEAFKD